MMFLIYKNAAKYFLFIIRIEGGFKITLKLWIVLKGDPVFGRLRPGKQSLLLKKTQSDTNPLYGVIQPLGFENYYHKWRTGGLSCNRADHGDNPREVRKGKNTFIGGIPAGKFSEEFFSKDPIAIYRKFYI